jgi:hypothetical protein
MSQVFPDRVVNDEGDARIRGGLTLRDYFAAQALLGLLASSRGMYSAKVLADEAYEMADTMLEARGP